MLSTPQPFQIDPLQSLNSNALKIHSQIPTLLRRSSDIPTHPNSLLLQLLIPTEHRIDLSNNRPLPTLIPDLHLRASALILRNPHLNSPPRVTNLLEPLNRRAWVDRPIGGLSHGDNSGEEAVVAVVGYLDAGFDPGLGGGEVEEDTGLVVFVDKVAAVKGVGYGCGGDGGGGGDVGEVDGCVEVVDGGGLAPDVGGGGGGEGEGLADGGKVGGDGVGNGGLSGHFGWCWCLCWSVVDEDAEVMSEANGGVEIDAWKF